MMIGKRIVTTFVGLGLVISAGSLPLLAQDPAAKKAVEKQDKAASAPAAKEKADPSRRVPNYFGQIGLTPEQRESIYKVRKTHQDRIDVLKKQIADAEVQSLRECEAVLTDVQRNLLDNIRNGGPKAAESPKAVK